MRYRRLAVLALLASIGALPAVPASAQSLVAAVLPTSRSVQVGSPATAFATIINTGDDAALSVGISLQTNIPASFRYQTTDPQTNALTGSPNTPVAIPAHGSQSFLIAITPTAPIPPTPGTRHSRSDSACARRIPRPGRARLRSDRPSSRRSTPAPRRRSLCS